MSHQASEWALYNCVPATLKVDGVTISATMQKVTLMVLADYHNKHTGICWPSATTIGALCGASSKTISRAIKGLESQGYLVREPRPGRPDAIRLNLNRTPDTVSGVTKPGSASPENTRPAEGEKSTPDTVSGVGQTPEIVSGVGEGDPGHSVRTPRTQCPGTPDTMSYEPVMNLKRTIHTCGTHERDADHDEDLNRPPKPPLPAHASDRLPAVAKPAWSISPETWRPDEVTVRLACCEVTEEHIKSFRLKLMDWRDKGHFSINERTQFVRHCKENRNATSGPQGRLSARDIANVEW